MKAFTLWQPWASLIANGSKRFEYRSWRTKHRGEIAIHASSRAPKGDLLALAESERLRSALGVDVSTLPYGCIVAVVVLEDVIEGNLNSLERHERWTEDQAHFGQGGNGRWAWALRDVRALKEPVRVMGMQGIWDVDADVEALVRAQLE